MLINERKEIFTLPYMGGIADYLNVIKRNRDSEKVGKHCVRHYNCLKNCLYVKL